MPAMKPPPRNDPTEQRGWIAQRLGAMVGRSGNRPHHVAAALGVGLHVDESPLLGLDEQVVEGTEAVRNFKFTRCNGLIEARKTSLYGLEDYKSSEIIH